MNDRINEDASEFAAFKDWLEETAEREDSSPESILSQLMSTYWILTELSDVLEETPYGDDLETSAGEGDAPEAGEHQAIIQVIESMAEMNQGQQPQTPQPSSGAIDPGVIRLVEALRSEGEGQASGGLSGAGEYRLEKLQDEVGELSKEIDARTSSIDDEVSRQSARIDHLDEELSELDAVTSEMVDMDSFQEFETRLEAQQSDLEEELDDVEDRFEDAYASIKQILEYVLNTADRNQERIEATIDALETASDDIETIRWNAERVATLKRDADRRGVVAPSCDHCDHTMDLSLLSKPHCPGCERLITGFEADSGFFRTSYVATTRAARNTDTQEHEVVADLRQELEQIESTEHDLPAEDPLE